MSLWGLAQQPKLQEYISLSFDLNVIQCSGLPLSTITQWQQMSWVKKWFLFVCIFARCWHDGIPFSWKGALPWTSMKKHAGTRKKICRAVGQNSEATRHIWEVPAGLPLPGVCCAQSSHLCVSGTFWILMLPWTMPRKLLNIWTLIRVISSYVCDVSLGFSWRNRNNDCVTLTVNKMT